MKCCHVLKPGSKLNTMTCDQSKKEANGVCAEKYHWCPIKIIFPIFFFLGGGGGVWKIIFKKYSEGYMNKEFGINLRFEDN